MRKTLLQVTRSVLGELNLNTPQVVLSSPDPDVQQVAALVVAVCDELAEKHNWQQLVKTYTITTEAGVDAYAIPADMLRMVNGTLWDISQQRPICGPETPAQWASIKARTTNSVVPVFRLQGRMFNFAPTPGGTANYTFDYVSGDYVLNAGDYALKAEFSGDADGFVFDDRLVINGVKLKFLESKGLDSSAALSDFNSSLDSTLGGNSGAPTLSLAPRSSISLVGVNNLPNGGFGA